MAGYVTLTNPYVEVTGGTLMPYAEFYSKCMSNPGLQILDGERVGLAHNQAILQSKNPELYQTFFNCT